MTVWTRRMHWFSGLLGARHDAAVRQQGRKRTEATAQPSAAAEIRTNYPALEERRASALRRMFPKLYSWHASRSEWMVAVEVQQYLAGAQNLADLENRIRVVEQRRHFGSG